MSNGHRLYQKVLEKMLALLDSGEYPIGGRLPPERELAERFGVSRPTIREAIIALETLERVTVKTGSGVYVQEHHTLLDNVYKSVTPFELTEARALIEGEAAALAAKMITRNSGNWNNRSKTWRRKTNAATWPAGTQTANSTTSSPKPRKTR
jgi:DNA-binding FadR family transcriptional regulator